MTIPPFVDTTHNAETFSHYRMLAGLARAPSAPVSHSISSTDFFNRFSELNKTQIAMAAQGNLVVLGFVAGIGASATVDLTSPTILAGVNQLVVAGLISSDDARRVLAT